MMKVLTIKTLFICCIATVMVGCKIAVLTSSGGDVQSGSGAMNCSASNFCEFKVTSAPFTESFTAYPREGYEFEKWSDGSGFLCGKSTNPTCTVNVGDGAVGAIIVALFQSGYLMPIFKDVGIDTDSDGVRNELDEDDDNDGIFDIDDLCPLNPNLNCGINDVSGPIFVDTTWSATNGPIRLVGTVQVAEGATLTILEGTEVITQVDDWGTPAEEKLEIYGALLVAGTPESAVVMDNIHVTPEKDEGNNVPTIELNYVRATDLKVNAYTSASFVARNSVFLGITRIGFAAQTAFVFEFNNFNCSGNLDCYVGLTASCSDGGVRFANNNVSGVDFSIRASALCVDVYHNNFVGGTVVAQGDYGPFDGGALDFSSNYWGTTDVTVIDELINDRNDDLSFPHFLKYLPILSVPHPDTPTGF